MVGRLATDFVRYFLWVTFLPNSVLLNQCAGRALRAKRRFLRFDRKCRSLNDKKPAEANACYGKKGYVIGEITALEVAVITYIKRGEG